jgi:hypothetical protein
MFTEDRTIPRTTTVVKTARNVTAQRVAARTFAILIVINAFADGFA